MELTKNDSKMLQGLSVLAMVWLHLFDRDDTGLFTSILFGVSLLHCAIIRFLRIWLRFSQRLCPYDAEQSGGLL